MTTHHHLALRLKKEYSLLLIRLRVFMDCYSVNFAFTFTFTLLTNVLPILANPRSHTLQRDRLIIMN